MLLRDERQAAICAVEKMCFDTADHYASAANKAGDADLAGRFNDLAQQRRALAAELAEHIRAMDDLPQQPDPDRQALGEVLTDIKAFFSGDARGVMITEREQAEDALTGETREALQHELPPDTRALLERLLAHSALAKTTLAALR